MALAFTEFGAHIVDERGDLYETSSGENDFLSGVQTIPVKFNMSMLDGKVCQVSAGQEHVAVLTDKGSMYVRGRGRYGALGNAIGSYGSPNYADDEFNNSMTFIQVQKTLLNEEDIRTIACGYDHTVAVTVSGKVFTFGAGLHFALGIGDNQLNQYVPNRVFIQDDGVEVEIVMVCAGDSHTMALSKDGTVFSWGNNNFGQLGLQDREVRKTPVKIPRTFFGDDPVVFIAAGTCHSAAVTQNGSLYTWGLNVSAQLGMRGPSSLSPQLVECDFGSPVSMVSCSKRHTIVVTDAGTVWSCGYDFLGCLGLGFDEDAQPNLGREFRNVDVGQKKIMTAATGSSISALVTASGELLLTGNVVKFELSRDKRREELQIEPFFRQCTLGALEGKRIGRCHRLESQRALAFCMGNHKRLSGHLYGQEDGAEKVSHFFHLKEELIAMIARLSISWPEGLVGQQESTVRQLGGGRNLGRDMKDWPR